MRAAFHYEYSGRLWMCQEVRIDEKYMEMNSHKDDMTKPFWGIDMGEANNLSVQMLEQTAVH